MEKKIPWKSKNSTGIRDDDFPLGCLKMQRALRRKRILAALKSDDVNDGIDSDTLSLIISAFVYHPLCAIRNWHYFKRALDNLQSRYDGKLSIYNLGVVNSLVNLELRKEEQWVVNLRRWKLSFGDSLQ